MNNKEGLIKKVEDKKKQLNSLAFGGFITQDVIKKRIESTIGSERGQRFITAITSAVTNNKDLAKCTNDSIYSGALLGESLNLSPSPQLGHYYLVPFSITVKDSSGKPVKDENGKYVQEKVAQFQLGYKGYLQLAIRSGQYKKINVLGIKEGELIRYNPLDEEIEVKLIEDEEEREKAPTIGYYAMFEYTNGFKKSMYWSKSKMTEHAKKYSQGYRSDLNNNTAYTFWSKNFDGMAYKTMLRQIISKWGIMSIDMQTAYEKDMATIKEDGTPEYVDNQETIELEEETIIVQTDDEPEAEIVEEETTQVKQVNINDL